MVQAADKKILSLASALISVSALVACGESNISAEYSAEDKGIVMPEPELAAREKCYGVALAQQNSCATEKLTDCAGTADEDYLPEKWQYVPANACEGRGGTMDPPEKPYQSEK